MTKLEKLEKTVAELDSKEFEAFSAWFESLQAERWDRQMEADVKSGRLNRLAERALGEFRGGKTTPL